MSIEITTQDEQALRAFVKRKPREVHELRAFLRGRLDKKTTLNRTEWWPGRRRMIEEVANRAVDRLLRKWKAAGLVNNATRGTWSWTGKP